MCKNKISFILLAYADHKGLKKTLLYAIILINFSGKGMSYDSKLCKLMVKDIRRDANDNTYKLAYGLPW